jgi:gas vesicle protein
MEKTEGYKVSTRFGFFLIGAGVGAAIMMLFAPKAGKEVRHDIADTAHRSLEYVDNEVQHLKNGAVSLYESSRDKASHILETGKDLIGDQKERVVAAIDAGKKAYQEKKVQSLSATAG